MRRKKKADNGMILDSGNREVFQTGAVRDIQTGKGRCDLMPLDVIGAVYNLMADTDTVILHHIETYKLSGDAQYLHLVLQEFLGNVVDAKDILLEVSQHFENGAFKYGENNWQKGIPTKLYINSAVRHYLKWEAEDTSERHDLAFIWNILCCAWTQEHFEDAELLSYPVQSTATYEVTQVGEVTQVEKEESNEGEETVLNI